MDTGKLDVFHYSRYKHILSVADGIRLTLCRMVQETVNQNRTVRSNAYGFLHIICQSFIVMNNLHAASSENVGRTNHYRISDAVCNNESLIYIDSHS